MSRARTSLGRTPINVDLNSPPSPERSILNQSPDVFPPPVQRSSRVADVRSSASVGDFVDRRSLDNEITRLGYTPTNRIVAVNDEGSYVPLIKAITPVGTPTYIAIDVNDGYVSHSSNDAQMELSQQPLEISNEIKDRSLAKAGLGVSGVAIECEGGLCAVYNSSKMSYPREENYVLLDRDIGPINNTAEFPIINMSDITRHSEEMCDRADQAMRELRNQALEDCLCSNEEAKEKTRRLNDVILGTFDLRSKIIYDFKDTINKLEDAHLKFKGCDQERHDKIVYNIWKRNEKFPYLVEICRNINDLNLELDEMICEFERQRDLLAHRFRHIKCVYERKQKVTGVCLWQVEEVDDSSFDEE